MDMEGTPRRKTKPPRPEKKIRRAAELAQAPEALSQKLRWPGATKSKASRRGVRVWSWYRPPLFPFGCLALKETPKESRSRFLGGPRLCELVPQKRDTHTQSPWEMHVLRRVSGKNRTLPMSSSQVPSWQVPVPNRTNLLPTRSGN